MEELLSFVKEKMEADCFVGLNTSEEQGVILYTVDYWVVEQDTTLEGEETEIKAGKQKVFTI